MARSKSGIFSSRRKASSVASPQRTLASGKRSDASFARFESVSIMATFCERCLFAIRLIPKDFFGSMIFDAIRVPILPAPTIAIFRRFFCSEPHNSKSLLTSSFAQRIPSVQPAFITVGPEGKLVFPSIST